MVVWNFTKSFTSEGSNEVQFVYLIFTEEKKSPKILMLRKFPQIMD